jgi:hypothetical protein
MDDEVAVELPEGQDMVAESVGAFLVLPMRREWSSGDGCWSRYEFRLYDIGRV